jgi:predicted  nucleic acid-binding Zn-ribbon protein
LKNDHFLLKTQKKDFISQIEKEKQEFLQKEIEQINIQLFNQFENERRKMENQFQGASDTIESLQNENDQFKQQIEYNQFNFESQKAQFISQIEKEKQEYLQKEIENIKNELNQQFGDDTRKMETINGAVSKFFSSF